MKHDFHVSLCPTRRWMTFPDGMSCLWRYQTEVFKKTFDVKWEWSTYNTAFPEWRGYSLLCRYVCKYYSFRRKTDAGALMLLSDVMLCEWHVLDCYVRFLEELYWFSWMTPLNLKMICTTIDTDQYVFVLFIQEENRCNCTDVIGWLCSAIDMS